MTSPRYLKDLPFYAIYLSSFLFALHVALPLYVNSSFLGQYVDESRVGLLYAIASILVIVALTRLPRILERFGNYKTVLFLLALEMAALLGLAFLEGPLFIFPIFIASQVLITVIFFNLDVFLEAYSEDSITGTIRGIMLTVLSIAIFLGPLLAGAIIEDGEFFRVYLVAALLLLPILFIITRRLRAFTDPVYERARFRSTFKKIIFAWHPDDGIRHVVFSQFLMRFFFSWMVLYTPIYLNKNVGFDWSEIGIILAIMLLPFILLEALVGHLADTRYGERGFMIAGFIIASFFTATLSFVDSASIVVWSALLFGTRIGISFIEITSESYFFKHIAGKDTNVLSIFRDMRPAAYLIGPITASVLLLFIPIKFLFLALATIMLSGIYSSIRMRSEPVLQK